MGKSDSNKGSSTKRQALSGPGTYVQVVDTPRRKRSRRAKESVAAAEPVGQASTEGAPSPVSTPVQPPSPPSSTATETAERSPPAPDGDDRALQRFENEALAAGSDAALARPDRGDEHEVAGSQDPDAREAPASDPDADTSSQRLARRYDTAPASGSSLLDAPPSFRPDALPPQPARGPSWGFVLGVAALSSIIAAAVVVAVREQVTSEPAPVASEGPTAAEGATVASGSGASQGSGAVTPPPALSPPAPSFVGHASSEAGLDAAATRAADEQAQPPGSSAEQAPAIAERPTRRAPTAHLHQRPSRAVAGRATASRATAGRATKPPAPAPAPPAEHADPEANEATALLPSPAVQPDTGESASEPQLEVPGLPANPYGDDQAVGD